MHVFTEFFYFLCKYYFSKFTDNWFNKMIQWQISQTSSYSSPKSFLKKCQATPITITSTLTTSQSKNSDIHQSVVRFNLCWGQFCDILHHTVYHSSIGKIDENVDHVSFQNTFFTKPNAHEIETLRLLWIFQTFYPSQPHLHLQSPGWFQREMSNRQNTPEPVPGLSFEKMLRFFYEQGW